MWRINMHLPPGFRFHPSDQDLIVHYLKNKVASIPLPASIIAEVELYQYNPWELPKKASFGEDEWYFFTLRDKKYPNGDRPNRAAASGYWKATGTDRPILSSCGTKNIGVKKALVFYNGNPPKGIKTDWITHEYRLVGPVVWISKRKGSTRLDDWVLCRVRQRLKGTAPERDGMILVALLIILVQETMIFQKQMNGTFSMMELTGRQPRVACKTSQYCLTFHTPQIFPLARRVSGLGIQLGAENSNKTKLDLPESSFCGIFGLFSDSYESPEFPTTETVSTLSFAQDNCQNMNSNAAVGKDGSDANNFVLPETIYSPTSKKLCKRFEANENELLLIPESGPESEITFHDMENTELIPDSWDDDSQLNFSFHIKG